MEARRAKKVVKEETEEVQQKPSSPSVSGSVFWWELLANLFTLFFSNILLAISYTTTGSRQWCARYIRDWSAAGASEIS